MTDTPLLPTSRWRVGDLLEPLHRPVVTRVELAKFSAAIGDFNPIHVDEEFAKSAGFPSAIAHGPLTLAMFAQMMGRSFGPQNVRGVSAQFRGPALPGEALCITGEVTELSHRDSQRRVVCKLTAARTDGTPVAVGSAEAEVFDE